MKNLFFLLGLISFVFSLEAQINAEDSTVQTIAYWEKHDTMVYLLTKLQIEARDSSLDTMSQTTYKITMVVEDSTATSYTVSWFYNLMHMVNNGENVPISPFLKKFTDYKVVIQTDELGAFESIKNTEEIQLQLAKLMRIQELAKPGMDSTTLQVKEFWDEKMADPRLVALLLKEVPMYFRYYGYKYALMQPLIDTVDTELLILDQKAKMEVTNWLREIDFSDDTYILRTQQTLDVAELKKIYLGVRETYDPNYDSSKPVDEALFKDFFMEDSMGAILHGPTGWIIRFEFSREVSSSPNLTKYDEIYFEME